MWVCLISNNVAVDETFNDGVMDCASYHIGTTQLASQFEALSCWPFTLCSTCNAARVIGLPRAVPCVSVSWTKDNLEEEYVPWFESREWGHKKIRDWFKNKHRGNKKLLFSKGNHMWLKRRLWLDGVSDRRRAKVGHTPAALHVASSPHCLHHGTLTQVPWDCGTYARVQVDKGWMSGCDRATFDTQPSEMCVQQAGDVMNIMAFDYLIDNHDRPGNCFVMDKRLIALDQSNGNFKKHPKPNRMQSPHLRIRPDIEARPTDTKQKCVPLSCLGDM